MDEYIPTTSSATARFAYPPKKKRKKEKKPCTIHHILPPQHRHTIPYHNITYHPTYPIPTYPILSYPILPSPSLPFSSLSYPSFTHKAKESPEKTPLIHTYKHVRTNENPIAFPFFHPSVPFVLAFTGLGLGTRNRN